LITIHLPKTLAAQESSHFDHMIQWYVSQYKSTKIDGKHTYLIFMRNLVSNDPNQITHIIVINGNGNWIAIREVRKTFGINFECESKGLVFRKVW
jgi:hypothetical protein